MLGTCGTTGSGIGVSVIKEFLALHGADISVQSELNKGSTFTIEFTT